MAKSISCSDAGKDCGWSATAEFEEDLMSQVKEHVLADIFIMLTFITTFLCSYAAIKFFQLMGGSQ